PEVVGDGLGGEPLVAGEHDRADPGIAELADRLGYAGRRRVDHPDEPDEGESWELVGLGATRRPGGDGEDPQPASGEARIPFEDPLARGLVEGDGTGRGEDGVAELDDPARRALGVGCEYLTGAALCWRDTGQPVDSRATVE